MRIELVKRISAPEYMGQTLSRGDVAFEVIPQVGDSVFWGSGWGGETCIYRYVGPDWIEIGLSPCHAREVADYVAAGWRLR